MHSAYVLGEFDGVEPAGARGEESGASVYEFGPFQLIPGEQRLMRDGKSVALRYRAFAVLEILVKRAGQLVDKSELLREVWKDCYVEEGNLTVAISSIRKALGDLRNDQRYIVTVSGRGYRFVAPTRRLTQVVEGPAAVEPRFKGILAARAGEGGIWAGWKGWNSVGLIVAAIAVLTVGLLRPVTNARNSVAAAINVRSLAILPFRSSGTEKAGGNLNVEIAEDLIDRLGQDGAIVVRPIDSVLKYANRTVDTVAAGNEQQVDAVLNGSVAADGGELKVTAELKQVKSGAVLWSGAFDLPVAQTQDLEVRLEESLSQSLFPNRAATRAAALETRNPDAHRLYLEGRFFWNKRSEDGIRRSIEDFQGATERDPGYALAYAGLADSYSALAIRNLETPKDAYSKAEAAAKRALELDPALADAHATLGKIALYYEWNPARGELELRRAIQLNPNSSTAHAWYAANLAAAGHMDQALKEALRAQELDPVSPPTAAEVGRIYYWNRQYDLAAMALRHTLDLDPQFPAAYSRLGTVHLMQKKYADAIREFKQARSMFSGDREFEALLGYAEAASGNPGAARQILADMLESEKREFIPAYSIALVYVALGDHAQALKWLSKCQEQRPASLIFARIDPLFDPIRSDPGFAAMLAEVVPAQAVSRRQ